MLDSLGRRGLWDAVLAFEAETGLAYDAAKRDLSARLASIVADIEAGELSSALAWCRANAAFLAAGPHPSPLPYHLHRAVLLAQPTPAAAVEYARTHMFEYLATQPVLELVTSRLFMGTPESPYAIENAPLAAMFRADYCRCHGWAREDPLEVAVDLGSRGGALNAIEKARKVMGDRLGNVRTWPELPVSTGRAQRLGRRTASSKRQRPQADAQMEVHLPRNRRYHSVFVCPVSKEQASDANPPTMLTCGHVINQESFARLLKTRPKSAKCPYCPHETSQTGAQQLYF